MKKILLPLFLFFFQISFSQNLVPNGSFEDTVDCPGSFAQMNMAVNWSNYRGTPDYFNSCNSTSVGVPSNIYDYQYAKTGNAYAGFAAFGIGNPNPNSRECLGVQLVQTLITGQKYFVSLYISRTINNSLATGVACNKIGVRFSTVQFSASNPVPIDNVSQVYTDSIVSDTVNWVKIFGSFIADSAYQFFSIGNFFDYSSVSFIQYDTLKILSYYFVDDIRVSTDSNFVNEINDDPRSFLVKIFPNPARDWIEVRGNDIESLLLYDVLGRVVYFLDSEFISPHKINVSTFPRGIYFLKLKTKSNAITQKIIFH